MSSSRSPTATATSAISAAPREPALAVDVACRVASQAAAGLAADATGDEEAERAGQELARAVVADWRTAVADQLGVRPYTVEEQFILDRSADTPVVPYGSTLLVAVIAARVAGVRADRRR